MFSEKLFDHKYDIDELILAFCSGHKHSKWVLNTRSGLIAPLDLKTEVEDGSDKGHVHIIESLPKSFLKELTMNNRFKQLDDKTKKEVLSIIDSCNNTFDLIQYFHEGQAGSYIVKTLKAACLDWLDMRNLIPPSMRHTSDMSMFDSLNAGSGQQYKVKVSIK